MNIEALSVCKDLGSPNVDITSFSNNLATLAANSVLVGNTSTHPENVSTRTRRYPKFPINLPVFPRICPSSQNGSYVEASDVSDVRAVHCTNGTYLNSPIDYTSCQELPVPQLNKYPDLIPGWGKSSGEGNGNPFQYSCLENPMGGAW